MKTSTTVRYSGMLQNVHYKSSDTHREGFNNISYTFNEHVLKYIVI